MSRVRPMLKYGNRPESFVSLPSRLYESGALPRKIPAMGFLGRRYLRFSPLPRFGPSCTTYLLSGIFRKQHLFTWRQKKMFCLKEEGSKLPMPSMCLHTKHHSFSDGRDTGSKSDEMEATQFTLLSWVTSRLR